MMKLIFSFLVLLFIASSPILFCQRQEDSVLLSYIRAQKRPFGGRDYHLKTTDDTLFFLKMRAAVGDRKWYSQEELGSLKVHRKQRGPAIPRHKAKKPTIKKIYPSEQKLKDSKKSGNGTRDWRR